MDRQDVLRKHAVGSANAVLCKTDEDVASKAIRECKSHTVNMVWCGLSDYFSQIERETKERVDVDSILDEARSAMESRGGENGGPRRSTLADILAVRRESVERSEGAERELRRLDERIGKIESCLPRNAMMVVVSGQGNTTYVRSLQQMRWRCKSNQHGGGKKNQGGKKDKEEEEEACKDKGSVPAAPLLWDERCDDHLNFSIRQAAQTVCLLGIKE